MDINQASQTITWLDNELRRYKSQATELKQKVDSQTIELTDQSKRIKDLEARLAATQGALHRFNTLEQTIQQLKEELVHMVREHQEEVQRHQREVTQSRQLEQESSSRAIAELRRALDALPPLDDKLTALRAEDMRLGEVVLGLQTRITAQERELAQLPDRITYVEGQRAQELKTISQMQEEINALHRRVEALAGRNELVDDIARKNEHRIAALSTLREDLTKQQAQLIEQQRLKEAQRDRTMEDWDKQVSAFREEILSHRKKLEQFERRNDENQQYLVAIEEFRKAIGREQQQTAELQRMAAERQRTALEEWVAEYEQRWTKLRLERESYWNQQFKRNDELERRLLEMEGLREEDVGRVGQLARELIEMRDEQRVRLRELWSVQEKTAIFQLDQARRWYDQIHGVVSEKTGDG